MENNEIINVQMTKEVFETLGSGGSGGTSTPTTTINLNNQFASVESKQLPTISTDIDETLETTISNASTPFKLNITTQSANYELLILEKSTTFGYIGILTIAPQVTVAAVAYIENHKFIFGFLG